MEIVGYVVGGLICVIAIFLIVKNLVELIKAVKQRKLEKQNKHAVNDDLEETKKN